MTYYGADTGERGHSLYDYHPRADPRSGVVRQYAQELQVSRGPLRWDTLGALVETVGDAIDADWSTQRITVTAEDGMMSASTIDEARAQVGGDGQVVAVRALLATPRARRSAVVEFHLDEGGGRLRVVFEADQQRDVLRFTSGIRRAVEQGLIPGAEVDGSFVAYDITVSEGRLLSRSSGESPSLMRAGVVGLAVFVAAVIALRLVRRRNAD
jgi:hypothetical protein